MKTDRLKIKSKNGRRTRFRPVSLLIIGVAVTVIGSSAWQVWRLHSQVEGQLAQLNQEKAELLQNEERLNEEIARLNNPDYIVQLAREQLGLVKQGEILISPKN